MTEVNLWDEQVIKHILLRVEFIITEVNEFETIWSSFFDRDIYHSILSLIKNSDWDELKKIEIENKPGFKEYLDVVRFRDQNKILYVATIYDSIELWQDPEIIDIFSLP